MVWNFEERCKFDSNDSVEDLRDYSIKAFKSFFMNICNFVKTETGFTCEIKNILFSWNNYLVKFDLKQQETKIKLELNVEPKFRLLAYWPFPPFIVYGLPGGSIARIFRKRKFEKYLTNLSNKISK